MNRSIARTRHPVSSPLLAALRPIFRYSRGREAYVLRGVGRHVGPVLVARSRGQHHAPGPAGQETPEAARERPGRR
jgi:hypothetical protein